jgi:DNA-binding MurR/RpiR family transcriptional regulator
VGGKKNNIDYSPELQAEQPQLYESLTSNLTPEEKTIVQGVVHNADVVAAKAAADAAQAAQSNSAS